MENGKRSRFMGILVPWLCTHTSTVSWGWEWLCHCMLMSGALQELVHSEDLRGFSNSAILETTSYLSSTFCISDHVPVHIAGIDQGIGSSEIRAHFHIRLANKGAAHWKSTGRSNLRQAHLTKIDNSHPHIDELLLISMLSLFYSDDLIPNHELMLNCPLRENHPSGAKYVLRKSYRALYQT